MICPNIVGSIAELSGKVLHQWWASGAVGRATTVQIEIRRAEQPRDFRDLVAW
jgi:hypothetical protein